MNYDFEQKKQIFTKDLSPIDIELKDKLRRISRRKMRALRLNTNMPITPLSNKEFVTNKSKAKMLYGLIKTPKKKKNSCFEWPINEKIELIHN